LRISDLTAVHVRAVFECGTRLFAAGHSRLGGNGADSGLIASRKALTILSAGGTSVAQLQRQWTSPGLIAPVTFAFDG